MKVRMIQQGDTGGWHDGEQWRSYPPVGEVLDTSDGHGAELCAQGKAQPVAEERKAETRPAPDDAEKRSAQAERDKAAEAAADAKADAEAAESPKPKTAVKQQAGKAN